MEKCYIAGKIGYLPEEVYKANFEIAKQEVLKLGYQPVSPVDLPHEHSKSWSDYMKEDLIELLKCDCLYALRNWRQSPGATIEVNIALSVGINIIQQPMLSKKPAPTPIKCVCDHLCDAWDCTLKCDKPLM